MAATLPAEGAICVIQGLSARPELNGERAIVLGRETSKEAASGYDRGRVPVKLLKQGDTLLLKPEALVPMPAERSNAAMSEDAYERLCSRAWERFEARDARGAIAAFSEAVSGRPDECLAHFQLGQVYEANPDEQPGFGQLAALSYVRAAELSAPESESPDFTFWSAAFVRAANLLTSMPEAQKPPWWTAVGLKQRCGLVLSNPQGFAPASALMCPCWQIMAHAFLLENNQCEAAKCMETAAGYEMDRERCSILLQRASELNGGQAV